MALLHDSAEYLFPNYKRYPIALVRGEGTKVWDQDGKEYLDFVSGIAVCNLGHCHPKIVEAITAQAQTLLHVSNLYHIKPQVALARLLVKASFADKVFFCNSGAEANEGAIKLARKYMRDTYGKDRSEIIVMNNSFHGRTLATLTATGQGKFKESFAPLAAGFKHVPFNDIEAVRHAVTEKTGAVLIEPIQGEGGVHCPADSYLPELRALCDEAEMLLIFDEVQVGMGRTGKLFAYEHYGITPDIMTLAKALAGGLPIGALLARDEIAESFSPGTHASTFGGNPVVTAAGVASLTTINDPKLLEHCRSMGAYFVDQLTGLKEKHASIGDIRGKGLILGVELEQDGAPFVNACLERGVLINCVQDRVLRFLPPLTVTESEIQRVIATLDEVFSVAKEPRPRDVTTI